MELAVTLAIAVVVIGLIGLAVRALLRDLRAGAGADPTRGFEQVMHVPVAIVTERIVVDSIEGEAALVSLTSAVVRGAPAVFVATLWPGIDSADLDDELDDDDHVELDASDDDNDDIPEEPDDEVVAEARRRRDTTATATATVIGLAARGHVRLATERVDRVDRTDASAGAGARGLLVRRVTDGPFDAEPALEQAVLAHLPLAIDVPIAELREVLESLHLEPAPAAETDKASTRSIDRRQLADVLAAYLARYPRIWDELVQLMRPTPARRT